MLIGTLLLSRRRVPIPCSVTSYGGLVANSFLPLPIFPWDLRHAFRLPTYHGGDPLRSFRGPRASNRKDRSTTSSMRRRPLACPSGGEASTLTLPYGRECPLSFPIYRAPSYVP